MIRIGVLSKDKVFLRWLLLGFVEIDNLFQNKSSSRLLQKTGSDNFGTPLNRLLIRKGACKLLLFF
ncbi:hypothetical protein C4Q31_01655 [Leptospira borgpetersenii serovar Ceylonica]|uniref:Uncharacterized protein n=1 Tax=Leptospira borgpetersenii str. Brem 328 TaxID=1049780 RepID=A0ABC9SDD8_LEPBO|nr:hypothetical protein C4Q31_01655 [Leptospira borgpetersenii serovar Ceylonica]EMN15815.1 hypothetical protein LEP1GSC056_3121 [Leptospira borgpetersenii str. Brem 328]